jgi:hypothetical protein
MNRQSPDNDYADAEVLASEITSLNLRRNQQTLTEAEADALYQEYIKACEEAGLKANPQRPAKK